MMHGRMNDECMEGIIMTKTPKITAYLLVCSEVVVITIGGVGGKASVNLI